MPDSDDLYRQRQPYLVDFAFDERVAAVFPDMIRRSIPGYEVVIPMLGVFAEQYVQDDTAVYDLGCSLGAGMIAIQQRIADKSVKLIGVDNSAAMLSRCHEQLENWMSRDRFELVESDITETPIDNASMVVLNFTLQFINPALRGGLVQKIYDGLKPGGVLVLSEKIRERRPRGAGEEDKTLLVRSYEQFKVANGYSQLEISQKRAALENVMQLDDQKTHLDRLKSAGFGETTQWFQCLNFCSFLTIKNDL